MRLLTSPQILPFFRISQKSQQKLKNIGTKNILYEVFTNNFKIINFINFGKDKTPATRQKGSIKYPVIAEITMSAGPIRI